MNLRGIHHIDFVVRDLSCAVAQYERVLGIRFLPTEQLANRSVKLARVKIGQIWLALVQPLSAASPVHTFLQEHGEGFYHIAFEIDDMGSALGELRSRGITIDGEGTRVGVEGWQLADISSAETGGVMLQLVQSGFNNSSGSRKGKHVRVQARG